MKRFFLLLVLLAFKNVSGQNTCLFYHNSYNQISKPILSGGASFSIEFWIRSTVYPDNLFGLTPITIVDIANTNNDTNRFRLTCARNNQLQFQLDDKNIFRSNTVVADFSWHHIAFVYDSSASKQYSLYVDGSLDTNLTGPKLKLSSTNIFRLGTTVGNAYPLEGALDEFRIFNHVRTDSAINADLYKEYCDINGKGLLAYYKFNDGLSAQDNRKLSVLYDFSGNGNHLSYNNFSLRGGNCIPNGCDNFYLGITLSGGNTRDTIALFDCDTVFAPSKTKFWTSTGKYFDTLTNAAGCDSILMVNVKIGNTISTITKVVCDSFITPLGKVIKSDTLIYEIYSSYTNCDSMVWFDVKKLKSSLNVLVFETCDSFVSSTGKVYHFSGDYKEHFINWKGCDSTVLYRLTINNDVNTFEYLQACDQGEIRGEWFTNSTYKAFNYQSYKGCDSTHYVFLTINRSKTTLVNVNACDSFISPQGKKYTISGAYDEVLRTSQACDSTVTYNVIIGVSKYHRDTNSVCNRVKIQDNWYDTTGTVRYFGKTYKGCDSIVDIWVVVKKTDLSIRHVKNVLYSGQDSAIYQWIGCGNLWIIPFENKQYFAPRFDGDYGVIVKYKGCQDTSACVSFRLTGINGIFSPVGGRLYPNPSSGPFRLELERVVDTELIIYDISGRLMGKYEMNGDSIEIETALESGVYVLRLSNGQGEWMLIVE